MTNNAVNNVRFAILSSSLFTSRGTLTASTRHNPAVSDVLLIRIFPGNTTVRQGEQIRFVAVGYDRGNAPVSGVSFRWRVRDTGRNGPARTIPDGKFEARVIGTFVVTARYRNLEQQATVTVLPSTVVNFPPISPPVGKGQKVSSSDNVVAVGSPDSPDIPEEGNWNNGNWPSFDDPGNQTGNPPGQPMDGGAGNGNFQLSIPVVSLPGRGTDLALNLNYNSRLWNKSGNELTYDIDRGFPAPGWSLGFGKIMDMGSSGGSMLIDADGTRHSYAGTVHRNWPDGYTYFEGHTADGKFIDYYSWRDPDGVYLAEAFFANGVYVSYGARGNNGVHPTYIRDANGNFLLITYRNNIGPAIETITDTTGRLISFDYDSQGRLIFITAPKMQGQGSMYGSGKTRTVVRFHYKPLTLGYSFASGITPMVREATPQVIDAVYYPGTETGYWFNDSDSYSTYGMITKVVEQRGMIWSTGTEQQGDVTPGSMTKKGDYNYPLTTTNQSGRTNGLSLSDAPTYEKLTESWASRDVDEDAVTTYKIQQDTSPRVTTVIQPNGSVSRQLAYKTPGQFNDGLVYSDESYVPDPNGTFTLPNVAGTFDRVAQSNVTWAAGDYDSPRPTYAEIIDENGHKVSTQYSYATGLFNQITRSCDYDNSNTLIRCSNATYENSSDYVGQSNTYTYSGRHIFNLPLSTNIENPDGSIASRTDYEYDNYESESLSNTPGVVMHEASHDPYTTDTILVQGECIEWEPHPYGGEYCVAWSYYEQNAYQPATDKRGNVTKTTNYSDAQTPSGAVNETRGYDITGNVVKSSSSCCEQTSVQYGITTQFAYPESQTRGSADSNSPHRITTYTVYDEDTGLLRQSTDANGRTSYMTYNPFTLRPTISYASTGAYSTWDYNESAMTVTEETREYSGTLGGKNITYLNGLGKTIKEEEHGPGGIVDIVTTKYTKFAEEWKQSRPYRTGDTVQFSEKFYDLQGRLIKIAEPDGSETMAFYNKEPRPSSASSLPGNTVLVVDAWGRERWGRYDQQERLAEVVEPNPNGNGSVTAAGNLVTKYTYNTLGRLAQTEQGDQLRKFRYDSLGRLSRQKLSEQSATLNEAGTYVGVGHQDAVWAEAFWYDNRSNLTQKTDPRGVKTLMSYQISGGEDPLNRIQARTYDLSGPRDTTYPISAAATVTYEYMTTGDKERIKKVRTAGILTEDYSYDTEGRVSEYKQTVDYRESYPMTTSYLYDTLDRISEVHYPAQYGLTGNPRKVVAHIYDTASRLTTLTYGGQQQAGNLVFNAADQMTQIKIGAAGANQVTENYTFDQQTGLLLNQTAVRNSTTLLDLSYNYNRNNSAGTQNGKTGHLTKILNNLDHNKDREYEFDAVGRLTKAKGGSNGTLSQQQYIYDRYGNRTSVTASGVAADSSTMPHDGIPNLAFNTANNRITTSGFQYDSAGNQVRALAEDGTTWVKYEYDAANRLQMVRKDDDEQALLQAFQYGSTNARLIDHDPASSLNKFYAAVGGTVLAEYIEYTQNVPTWVKGYTYLGDSQLATLSPNGSGGDTSEFNHPDRLGMRLKTNPTTGTTSEQAHLPFGRPLDAESTLTTNTRRFTSYERSSATKLDYAINRTYDSKQGRFTQVDPIGMQSVSISNPQTLNLYAYCTNDPINHVDPSGLGFFSFLKKLFGWVNKILKWIVIAVVVVAVVIAIVHSGPAALGFLKSVLGIVAKLLGIKATSSLVITNLAGGVTLGTVSSISIGLSGQIIAGLYAVGALSNRLSNRGSKNAASGTRNICKYYSALLTRFATLFNNLWDATMKDPKRHERGAIIGQVSDGTVIAGHGEPVSYEIYSGTKGVTDRSMGEEFTHWLRRKKQEAGNTTWIASVHTHPRSTARPSGMTEPTGTNLWGSGDYGTAGYTGLDGVIITSTKLVVYNANRILCTLNR